MEYDQEKLMFDSALFLEDLSALIEAAKLFPKTEDNLSKVNEGIKKIYEMHDIDLLYENKQRP